jgi:hypothetical protein
MTDELNLKITKPSERLLKREKRNKRRSCIFKDVKYIIYNKTNNFLK